MQKNTNSKKRANGSVSELKPRNGSRPSAARLEQKALSLLATFENAGKPVYRISIDGQKIELEFFMQEQPDEFDRINMRHDQT